MPSDYGTKEDDSTPTTERPDSVEAAVGETGKRAMQGPPDRELMDGAEVPADAKALDARFASPGDGNRDDGSGYDWKDRGIQEVPVDRLPWPEGITRANFDHHITYDDAIRATQEYRQMQPLLAQGYTGDHFSAEDGARGVDYEHGRRRVYDLFHGSDPIRVTKDGDRYNVEAGRHRVYAAKVVGIEHLPARVFEKVAR